MTREENGAVTGAQCARGESFFRQEMLEKRRFLTMVVEAEGCLLYTSIMKEKNSGKRDGA